MIRTIAYQLHLYLGLTIGAVLLVMGLSGSSLVFRPELDQAFYSSLASGRQTNTPAPNPLEQARSSLLARYPGWHLQSIIVPGSPNGAYIFSLSRQNANARSVPLLAAVEAGSGQILNVEPLRNSWLLWIRDFHTNFFSGRSGRQVEGYFAVVLLILSASGFILWLPRKQWKLTRGASWKRQLWNTHNAVGSFALLLLTLQAFSAAYFAFPNLFRSALGLHSSKREKAKERPRPSDANTISLDRMFESFRSAWPTFTVSSVNLPADSRSNATFRGRFPADPYWRTESSRIELNLRNGRFGPRTDFSTLLPAEKALALLTDLHYARLGGSIVVKLLWFALGLAPGTLYITGLLLWLNRTKAKLRSRKAAERRLAQETLLRV